VARSTQHEARAKIHLVRVAMFSPLPPTRSGIADYTVELLTTVGRRHEVEVFVASREELESWPAGRAPFTVRGAHDFVWARLRTPYDLVVYQMGNAWCHDYMWPYLFRWPGLVVLHDAHLHHARAWSLLRGRRQADYRDELAFNHPELPPEAAEIGLSGFAGPIYYFWPMLRAVVESARGVAVHNPCLAADLAAEFEGACVRAIPMGVADPQAPAGAAEAVRRRHGLASDAVVLAAFGAITEEKRILSILPALAVARQYQPNLRLLLVGQSLPHFNAMTAAREYGVEDLVTIADYVDDAALPAHLAASDIVLSLRWPSARETSASWLRAIAAGRPTVVTDLAQQADLPTLDPRSWTVVHAQPTLEQLEPVAVSLDVLDETHSLTLAVKRLAADAALRERLGAAARAHWLAHHTVEAMAARYDEVMQEMAARPDPDPVLPHHLRPDAAVLARALVSPFRGVTLD
jgi:glycosyltransferase involved in cell wall biosynthesis